MSKHIAQVVVGLPVEGPFDYAVHPSLQENIHIGQRVLVSFNRQKRVAYVVALKAESEFKRLNSVLEILENQPSLTPQALAFIQQFKNHYGCSMGEAIETYLPKVLRQKRSIALESIPLKSKKTKESYCLVHSISYGKQYTYVRDEMKKVLAKGHSVIVMVPEKEMQKSLGYKLEEDFPGMVRAQKDKEKVKEGVELFQELFSGQSCIFLGTRSAIFAPLPLLGLIVVFDEENAAYKQEQSPHYHAVQLAKFRAATDQARLILASAVPSSETWKCAHEKNWQREGEIEKKDVAVHVIDMNNYNPQKSWIVSAPLQNELQSHMEENKKVLLFLNRRGFSMMTQCNECGYQVRCERCDIPMTYMFSKKKLTCRQCNAGMEPPKICPHCRSRYLRTMGSGVEKLASDFTRFYPQARVAMFDKDTKKLHKKTNLVIATQAVFRIQDEFKPDLVAALNIDSALHRLDYKSSHHVFALLVHLYQMAGKKLIVQTKLPDLPHIQAIQKLDFNRFYTEDLKQRKDLSLPPYAHICSIGLRGKKEEGVLQAGFSLHEALEEAVGKTIEIFDLQPDAIPKLRDQYRYTIMLKSKSLPKMQDLVQQTLKNFKNRSVIVTINVDP